ncbi:MAG: flagellar biosynthesis anti-sigma factor FlgM [Pyrinomonadaceae bacterium]
MSKIIINKTNDIEAIRATQRNDVHQAGKISNQSVDQKNSVGEDKLEISGRVAEVGKLVDQIKELPDVRKEKVIEFREKITGDFYHPRNEEVAEAILKDEAV